MIEIAKLESRLALADEIIELAKRLTAGSSDTTERDQLVSELISKMDAYPQQKVRQ